MSTDFDYNPDYDFTAFQTDNPTTPLPASEVDSQFQQISQSVNQLAERNSFIQRADGALKNAIVTAEALAPGLMIGITSFAAWTTLTVYPIQAGVIINNAVYGCILAHTSSGSFANDLAAGKWVLIIDFTQFLTGQIATLIPAVSFRNFFINGSCLISQRATSFVNVQTTLVQCLDMWSAWKGAATNGMTVSQVAGASTADGAYYPNLVRVARAAANTDISQTSIALIIPQIEMRRLAGKTVTLSYVARAGANFTSFNGGPNPKFSTGTVADEGSAALKAGTWTGLSLRYSQTQAITTTLTRYSASFTIPAGALEGAFQISNVPVGTAGANDYFEIGGLQLELGATATTFEMPPFETERQRCLPFFRKSFPYSTVPAQNTGSTAGAYFAVSMAAVFGAQMPLNPEMYTTSPVLTTYNPSAANSSWRDITNSADRTSLSGLAGQNGLLFEGSGGAANAANYIHWSLEGGL